MPPLYQSVPSPRRRAVESEEAFFVRQTAILHARDADDRRRIVLATVVVCTGLFVAGIALWQARTARTVYVPMSSEPAAPSVITVMAAAPRREPVAVEGVLGGDPMGVRHPVTAAPALPQTWTPTASRPAATPVDYAARDQEIQNLKSRIEALDEDVRIVREHPNDSRYYWHYHSPQYRGIDQTRRDAYLKELDRQRNELRRQKWALEGR